MQALKTIDLCALLCGTVGAKGSELINYFTTGDELSMKRKPGPISIYAHYCLSVTCGGFRFPAKNVLQKTNGTLTSHALPVNHQHSGNPWFWSCRNHCNSCCAEKAKQSFLCMLLITAFGAPRGCLHGCFLHWSNPSTSPLGPQQKEAHRPSSASEAPCPKPRARTQLRPPPSHACPTSPPPVRQRLPREESAACPSPACTGGRGEGGEGNLLGKLSTLWYLQICATAASRCGLYLGLCLAAQQVDAGIAQQGKLCPPSSPFSQGCFFWLLLPQTN